MPTFKRFRGYRVAAAVIGDKIALVENADGNTNVRFRQADTLRRFFTRIEEAGIRVDRFRADCGSCSKDIVSEVERHSRRFYIRANKCESLYDDILTLRGWRKEEINGIDFELLLSAKRQRPMPNLLMIRDWVKFQTRTSPYSAKTVPSAGGEAAISSSIPFKSVSGWLKNFSMLR